jgi:hypothetical protein
MNRVRLAEESDDRSSQYTNFLKRSFRDIEKISWSSEISGARDPRLNASTEPPFQSMYHSNFLRAVRKIYTGGDANDDVSSRGRNARGFNRIMDVKAFGPSVNSHSQSEPLGFAVLFRGCDGSIFCFLQRLEHTLEAREFNQLGISNPDSLSSADRFGNIHGLFRRSKAHTVSLGQAFSSSTRVVLKHVGGGILIAVALSGTNGRIDFLDLHAENPSFERVRMNDGWSDIVSARASDFGSNIVLSCLGKRSHFMVKFERTPRCDSTHSVFSVSVTKPSFVNQSNELPCHIAISPTVALVFPTTKQDKKWALLRVDSENEGKTEQFKNVDFKAKVTFVGRFHSSTSELPTILVGTEDGGIAVLPFPLPQDSATWEIRFLNVFDGSDATQRSIVHVKQTSLQTMFVVMSRTSAALVSVDDQQQQAIAVLSKKVSTTVTSFGVQHVHLPRQVSANPNFVLLSAEANGVAVNMHTFLQLPTLSGSAPSVSHPGQSPTASTRDIGLPPSTATAKTSPQLAPQPAPKASPSPANAGFFSKLRAKITSKFSKANLVPADQFSSRVQPEPIAILCDGFCRKSLTSVSEQHRIIPLDSRVHGFLVWLRLHNQEDDLLFLSDHVISHGLSVLRPEEQ